MDMTYAIHPDFQKYLDGANEEWPKQYSPLLKVKVIIDNRRIVFDVLRSDLDHYLPDKFRSDPLTAEEAEKAWNQACDKDRFLDTLLLNKELARLDKAIWKAVYPAETASDVPSDYRAGMWLQSDLEAIRVKDETEYNDVVRRFVEKSPLADEVLEKIDFDQIEKQAAIRTDWASALKKAKKGSDLSSDIGFGFSKFDLIKLAKLHKANKFRKKIEDLLSDCNYHSECGEWSEGVYKCLEEPAGDEPDEPVVKLA